ncbi:MAG: hypothetical protein IJ852_03510, partial [Alphaproteobacteria bacterium]|nr:hypothetical protein [Alphaproteobacteria bacterium]
MSTVGKNFEHNLSVKKVRYSLSNATITNCILNNQILRIYNGMYGWSSSNKRPLILNDGTVSTITSGECSPNNMFNMSCSYQSVYNENYNIILRLFRDPCIQDIEYQYYIGDGNHSWWFTNCYHIMDIYGITGNCKFWTDGRPNIPVSIYNNSGNYDTIYTEYENKIDILSFNSTSYYSNKIRMKIGPKSASDSSYMWISYIIPNLTKTLQSTTPITVNPLTYTDLINNVGIYLANYNGENWICFQGDGELHVTVQGGASKPELKFCNVSGDTDVHPISAQTTYIITP